MKPKQVFIGYEMGDSRIAGYKFCPSCRTELVLRENGGRLRPTCPACGFMQFINPAPAVSVMVIDRDQVLLGKRTGSLGRAKWALPSGYIEFEDEFLTTAIREVKEETGFEVEITSILNIASSLHSPGFHFLAVYLLARVLGGEIRAGDDLEEVAWFPLSGPLPEMAFEEDLHTIEMVLSGDGEGLPVDPNYATPRSI